MSADEISILILKTNNSPSLFSICVKMPDGEGIEQGPYGKQDGAKSAAMRIVKKHVPLNRRVGFHWHEIDDPNVSSYPIMHGTVELK